MDTKDLYRFSLPRYIYCVGISQIQVLIKRWNCCYNLFISGATWLFLRSEKKQSPWFPWPFHHPSLLMKTSFSHLPHVPKAAQHTASYLQKYTLSIPISSFSLPQILQKWTGQGTNILLVQKHEEKHPWGIKLWQPEAAHSIGGFARRKCSSSDAKSASLMPAALLSAISAWQLFQDPCLVLFLGFISAFQLSGPLCTHCDSIGNIMYVLAWVFLKELALI